MAPDKLLKQASRETAKENLRKFDRVVARREKLESAIKEMGQDGNWNYDPYMLGLYNGLVYAKAIMENKPPQYRDRPEGGFRIEDPAIKSQLEQAQRTEEIKKAEKDSREFEKKILGGL